MTGPKLATVAEIVAEVRRDAPGASVDAQLTALFDKFNMAARLIDPTITGSWLGRDITLGNVPFSITFQREGGLGGLHDRVRGAS